MSSCDWGFAFEAMKTYHDTEWGVPVHDDRVMFEHLMMSQTFLTDSPGLVHTASKKMKKSFFKFANELPRMEGS